MQTDRVPPPPPSPDAAAQRRRERILAARVVHWARARRLTLVLLALWLATGFGTVFFARDLDHLSVFGWPLSFYMAAQGASLIYLSIIGAYAWRMRVLDRDFARMLEERA
jgi:putative solute:sodium symporter small subunit